MSHQALQNLCDYVDDCIKELGKKFPQPHPLSRTLASLTAQIEGLQKGQTLDMRPADYFYRFLAEEPFREMVADENRARNLATLSDLLNSFQSYYHYTVVTADNRIGLRFHFFASFLRLLYDGGINEYEDPDQPFPNGYVQVMTIHQAKGLEFPVVVAGGLDSDMGGRVPADNDLQRFYHRPPLEPAGKVKDFDRRRLHYVAFSRPEKVLVLTADGQPRDRFKGIWEDLPQWPYVEREVLGAQSFELADRVPVKKHYSFTGDLKLYETCPRQYKFFRHYDFTPSRSAVIFFGLLVHQTIEDIHRMVLEGALGELGETRIRQLFEANFYFLSLSDVRPIGEAAKEGAFEQVMNYFNQNKEEMKSVIETEVDVSVEKDGYVLTGKVDLLMGAGGELELLDFKTSPKPEGSPELLASYEAQLATYAHILEHRHGKRPSRLLLYWTSEPHKEDALMEFPYRPEVVEEAGRRFDELVGSIEGGDFRVIRAPEKKICKECDLKRLCTTEGIIPDPDG